MWEKIEAFQSPAEYRKLRGFLEQCLAEGSIEEMDIQPDYSSGEVYGGQFFRNTANGQVWRLVEPDFPFRGLWEPVEFQKNTKGLLRKVQSFLRKKL